VTVLKIDEKLKLFLKIMAGRRASISPCGEAKTNFGEDGCPSDKSTLH
jgi:hypothetical protein